MRPEELGRSVQVLESSAVEGSMLAGDVARDRTKVTFARAHARELGGRGEPEPEKLQDAAGGGRVVGKRGAAVSLAGSISQALGDVQTAPDSRATGLKAAHTLSKLSQRAGR